MFFDNMLADGKTQAASTRCLGAAFVGAVESFEDSSLLFLRNAYAVIRYGNSKLVLGFRCKAHGNMAALVVVFYAVVQKVHDELGKKRRIAIGIERLRINVDRHAFGICLRLDEISGIADKAVHGYRFPCNRCFCFFHLGKVHDCINERQHALGLIHDTAAEKTHVFRFLVHAVCNHFSKAADGCQWRLQFMRNVCREFAAHLLCGVCSCQVAQNDQEALLLVIIQLDMIHDHTVRTAEKRHGIFLASFSVVCAADGAQPVFVMIKACDSSVAFVFFQSEEFFDGLVVIDNFLVFIQKDNAVRNRIDDSADRISFFLDIFQIVLYIVVLFFQLCNQRLEFLVIVRQLMSGPAFHDLLDQISQKMKRPENFFCLLLGSREASNHENKEEYDDFR